MAERYTYVPYIGLFIAVVWLVGDTVAKYPKLKVAAVVFAVVTITACAAKTEAQVKLWRDTVTLFTHTIERNPGCEVPYLALGMAYGRQGDTAAAEENFKKALDYNPQHPLALSFSAYYLMQAREQRNLPLAGQRLQLALRVAPDYFFALTYMAQWSSLMGRPNDEEIYSRRALASQLGSVEARLYLADALQAQGKFDEAEKENLKVLSFEPNNWEARNNLGIIYSKQGLMDEALKEHRLSLAINPNQAMAHSQIGRILTAQHHYSDALEEFNQALRFDLAKAYAHNDLGVVLFQMGDYEKAAEQFSDAVRLDPAYADARRNLDLAQERMKNEKVENGRK